MQLFVFAIGVWVSFLFHGWALEAIKSQEFGEDGKFTNTDFLIAVQSTVNTIVSAIILTFTSSEKGLKKYTAGVAPQEWGLVVITYLGAHKFGMGALNYVTYPVQVLLKCCKPIPVMIGEMVVAKETHSASKKLSVVLLVVGVMMFMFFKKTTKSGGALVEFNSRTMWGFFLILITLMCDAVYGPGQNKIKRKHPNLTAYHNMLAMNGLQGTLSIIMLIVSGDLAVCISFAMKHFDLLKLVVAMSATMCAGNLFLYQLQNNFGALAVTTVTTLRKLASIIISVIFFGHTMTIMQWMAVALVVLSKWIAEYLMKIISPKPKDAKTK